MNFDHILPSHNSSQIHSPQLIQLCVLFLFYFFVFTHQVQDVTISSGMCDFPLECD